MSLGRSNRRKHLIPTASLWRFSRSVSFIVLEDHLFDFEILSSNSLLSLKKPLPPFCHTVVIASIPNFCCPSVVLDMHIVVAYQVLPLPRSSFVNGGRAYVTAPDRPSSKIYQKVLQIRCQRPDLRDRRCLKSNTRSWQVPFRRATLIFKIWLFCIWPCEQLPKSRDRKWGR